VPPGIRISKCQSVKNRILRIRVPKFTSKSWLFLIHFIYDTSTFQNSNSRWQKNLKQFKKSKFATKYRYSDFKKSIFHSLKFRYLNSMWTNFRYSDPKISLFFFLNWRCKNNPRTKKSWGTLYENKNKPETNKKEKKSEK